jgi:signal peptidase II
VARTLWVPAIILSIVLVDQLTKNIVDRTLFLHQSIPVIDNVFSLTYIRNKGAAFGILAHNAATFRLAVLIVFSLIAIGFVISLIRRLPRNERWLTVSLAFILGGALGNLIDRVWYGEVIDFLDFYWSTFHWPAFNVADSFITVGVVMALFRFFRSKGDDPFSLSR